MENKVIQDIHRCAPGGYAPQVLKTNLIEFDSGMQGLQMELKGMTIPSAVK